MLQNKIKPYLELMRLNKPIGIYLLLWPTLWALWIAGQGRPDSIIVLIFIIGVILTRSAGCIINDYADQKFDGLVKRTTLRPLVTGRIAPKAALVLFVTLMLTAFALVCCFTNLNTILASIAAAALAILYPFTKRWISCPQVVLGIAFAFSIPMAYFALNASLTLEMFILFLLTIIWVTVYDTFYAMVDRDDDIHVGIKSTAILFGQFDTFILYGLQILILIAWLILAKQLALSIWFYVSLVLGSLLFIYQAWLIKNKNRDNCFKAFLNSHWFGAITWLGLVCHYAFT